MSAQWDSKQGTRFYFGNAARDLASSLPADDYAPEAPAPVQAAELIELLDSAQSQLDELTAKSRELSFLVSDLKRLIR